MKTILVISFYYPPYSRGGVNRILRFTKALTSAGKELIIIAPQDNNGINNKVCSVHLPILIRKLCALPSFSDSISQSKSNRLPILFWKLFKFLSIPDRQIYWLPFVIGKVREIVRDKSIDCIVSTSPPVSSHICGLILKNFLRRPWFTEFRDTWIYDPLEPFLRRSKGRLHIESFLEKQVIKYCDGIVVNSDVALRYFQERYPKSSKDKAVLVYTGYDVDDHKNVEVIKAPKKFTVVHTGSFGRSRYNIKIMNVLKGLQYAMAKQYQFSKNSEVLLVGELSEKEKCLIKDMSLESIVKHIPPVSHQKAIQFQKNADLLLVVNHSSSILTADIPGKVFEYIGTGKPILAVTTPGALNDIVKRTNGFVVYPEDSRAIGTMILHLYELHQKDKLNRHINQKLQKEMTTQNNVKKLVTFMNGICDKRYEKR